MSNWEFSASSTVRFSRSTMMALRRSGGELVRPLCRQNWRPVGPAASGSSLTESCIVDAKQGLVLRRNHTSDVYEGMCCPKTPKNDDGRRYSGWEAESIWQQAAP